jgi:hypothetical protein
MIANNLDIQLIMEDPKMEKKNLDLKKTVEKHNSRVRDNYALYSEECRRQGVKVGEPIDIMKMLEGKKQK